MLLYSAVHWTAQSTLRLADLFIPVHQLDFSWKHSSNAAITRISIARCSYIQLSELGHCGENENAQALKR